MRYWLLIFAFVLFTACEDNTNKEAAENAAPTDSVATLEQVADIAKPTPTENIEVDSITLSHMPWIDSLMDVYLKKTEDESIRSSQKAKIPISWLYDKMYGTDSTFYIVLHLGHDMEDHFATDGWLYIDTFTRSIYEYDLPNDVIYKWKGN